MPTRFGESTPIGHGGIATTLADGDYGEFTVLSGVITPRVSPLTVGSVTHGSEDFVIEAGSRTVSSWSEVEPILDSSFTGTVYFRSGVYDNDAYNFYNKQLSLTDITFEGDDPANRPELRKWSWSGASDPSFGAFRFRQLLFTKPHPTTGNFWGVEPASNNQLIYSTATMAELDVQDCEINGQLPVAGDGGVMVAAQTGVIATEDVAVLKVKNCDIHNLTFGLSVRANRLEIEGNEIYATHADGIAIQDGPSEGYIRNNHWRDIGCNPSYFHADFIQFQPQSGGDGIHGLDIYGNTCSPGRWIGEAFAQCDPAGTVTPVDFTGTTLTDAESGIELRANADSGNQAITLPDAATNEGRQFCFRRTTTSANTVSFTLSGSDTHEATVPDLTAAGEYFTFVSDGTSVWKTLPGGRRAYDYLRYSDATLGALEDGKRVMVDATAGSVDITLPTGTTVREYSIQRIFPATNTVRLLAPGGGTLNHHGADVASITMPMGYSVDVVYNDSTGKWDVTEDQTTMQGFFGNAHPQGNYSDIRFHGNILNVLSGHAVKLEQAVPGFEVFNNTIIRPLEDDANNDGVVGGYEGGISVAGNLNAEGATAETWSNVAVGQILLTAGASGKNNIGLGLDGTSTITSMTNHFAGSSRSDFRPVTRAEVIAAARPQASGPLDGTLIGALGTNDTNGYYNFATGAVNTGLPAPTLTSTVPADGETYGLDAPITLNFNQFISFGTGNITVYNETDSVAIQTFDVASPSGIAISNDALTITPSSNLPDAKIISVRIDATAIVGHYGEDYAGLSGTDYSFTSQDGAVTVFNQVNAVGSRLTKSGLDNGSAGATKFLFAIRMQREGTSNALSTVLDMHSGVQSVDMLFATAQLRLNLVNSSTISFRQSNAIPTTGSPETLLVTIDTAAATADAGVEVYLGDSDIKALATVTWTQNATVDLSGVTEAAILNRIEADRNLDGVVEFVYFDSPTTLPDITQQSVRDSFGSTQIGSDGSGPTGSQPLIYFTGAASVWNAGTNQGDGGNFTQAGTAFSDVSAPDTTAPVLSNFAVAANGQNEITVDFDVDEVGTAYYEVDLSAVTYTAADLQSSGTAVNVTTTGPQSTITIGSLSPGDTRHVAITAFDGAGNSAPVQTASATTVAANPTDITLSNSSVAENAAVGTTVGVFTATDPNPTAHTFALVSGTGDTDNASFQLDDETLMTNAVFDFETKSSYSIRVRATNQGGGTYEEAFTITITDVDEVAPTIVSASIEGNSTLRIVFSESVSYGGIVPVILSSGDTATATQGAAFAATTLQWNVSRAIETDEVIYAQLPVNVAQDTAGNQNASTVVAVTNNSTGPVVPTNVVVNSPAANEDILTGTPYTIDVVGNNGNTLDVEISTDGGTTFTALASAVASNGQITLSSPDHLGSVVLRFSEVTNLSNNATVTVQGTTTAPTVAPTVAAIVAGVEASQVGTDAATAATEVAKVPRASSALAAGGNFTRTKDSASSSTLTESLS